HRRRERALEREPGAADRVEGGVGERGAGLFDGAHPAVLLVPRDLHSQTVQHLQRRLRDLGSDSVAGDQRRLARHGRPGVRFFTARVSADQGSSPSPRAVVRNPTRPVRASTIPTVNSAAANGWSGRPAAAEPPAPPRPTFRRGQGGVPAPRGRRRGGPGGGRRPGPPPPPPARPRAPPPAGTPAPPARARTGRRCRPAPPGCAARRAAD